MSKFRELLRNLARDTRGLTAVEYAVLGSIVVAAIASVGVAFDADLTAAFEGLFDQT